MDSSSLWAFYNHTSTLREPLKSQSRPATISNLLPSDWSYILFAWILLSFVEISATQNFRKKITIVNFKRNGSTRCAIIIHFYLKLYSQFFYLKDYVRMLFLYCILNYYLIYFNRLLFLYKLKNTKENLKLVHCQTNKVRWGYQTTTKLLYSTFKVHTSTYKRTWPS